ncbi:DUF4998 domain-containing protein [Chitinophaga oryziterrae]
MMGCSKKATDYRSFLNGGEIIYPGTVSNIKVSPGNGRIQIRWQPSPDPSVKKYIVFWNNGIDSSVIPATTDKPGDTVKCIISNLSEYTYNFLIYSYDSAGNRSIASEINNIKVYGNSYLSSLYNRPYDIIEPGVYTSPTAVTLKFGTPDTINVTTEIRYTDANGITQQQWLSPDSTSISIDSYQPGSTIYYKSGYIPVRGAIDTFFVTYYDSLPHIPVLCNKSLFSALQLPNDVGTYEGQTGLDKLWDGSVGPQSYPNIFHSDGSHSLPHHFTFDMGQLYNELTHVEITGRNCCNNPDHFEVWGIADITNAATTLPGNDAGWKDEAIAKGWTLLQDVTRTDDGIAPFKINLRSDIPPVRYIRIRVLHVTSGDGSYSNISELSFWARP